jgi:hypothetical protein
MKRMEEKFDVEVDEDWLRNHDIPTKFHKDWFSIQLIERMDI